MHLSIKNLPKNIIWLINAILKVKFNFDIFRHKSESFRLFSNVFLFYISIYNCWGIDYDGYKVTH